MQCAGAKDGDAFCNDEESEFFCHQACATTADCGLNSYCRSFECSEPDQSVLQAERVLDSCEDGAWKLCAGDSKDICGLESEQDPDCDVCVDMGNSAYECYQSCEITTFGAEGNYQDTCADANKSCQPIGAQDSRRLVCESFLDGVEGDSCDRFSDPCGEGLACYNSPGQTDFVCREQCRIGGACSGGNSCCTITEDDGTNFGLCLESCDP